MNLSNPSAEMIMSIRICSLGVRITVRPEMRINKVCFLVNYTASITMKLCILDAHLYKLSSLQVLISVVSRSVFLFHQFILNRQAGCDSVSIYLFPADQSYFSFCIVFFSSIFIITMYVKLQTYRSVYSLSTAFAKYNLLISESGQNPRAHVSRLIHVKFNSQLSLAQRHNLKGLPSIQVSKLSSRSVQLSDTRTAICSVSPSGSSNVSSREENSGSRILHHAAI